MSICCINKTVLFNKMLKLVREIGGKHVIYYVLFIMGCSVGSILFLNTAICIQKTLSATILKIEYLKCGELKLAPCLPSQGSFRELPSTFKEQKLP